ncbi:MAG: hypothetical protein AB1725_10245 [Armatimonadota bacterium]
MLKKLIIWTVLVTGAVAAPHIAIATCAQECPYIDIPCPPDCWPTASDWTSWCYQQGGFCCECFIMHIWCGCPDGGFWDGFRQYSTWGAGECKVIDDYRSACKWAVQPPE